MIFASKQQFILISYYFCGIFLSLGIHTSIIATRLDLTNISVCRPFEPLSRTNRFPHGKTVITEAPMSWQHRLVQSHVEQGFPRCRSTPCLIATGNLKLPPNNGSHTVSAVVEQTRCNDTHPLERVAARGYGREPCVTYVLALDIPRLKSCSLWFK